VTLAARHSHKVKDVGPGGYGALGAAVFLILLWAFLSSKKNPPPPGPRPAGAPGGEAVRLPPRPRRVRPPLPHPRGRPVNRDCLVTALAFVVFAAAWALTVWMITR
jgi:hypothetical protein